MTKKKQWARSFGAHESERTRAVSLTGERIGARQAMELELGYGAVLLVR
jgi:hypothetical protein